MGNGLRGQEQKQGSDSYPRELSSGDREEGGQLVLGFFGFWFWGEFWWFLCFLVLFCLIFGGEDILEEELSRFGQRGG